MDGYWCRHCDNWKAIDYLLPLGEQLSESDLTPRQIAEVKRNLGDKYDDDDAICNDCFESILFGVGIYSDASEEPSQVEKHGTNPTLTTEQ